MQALYAHGPKDLRLSGAPVETLGPKQVRIKMARGGICGSDMHYFNHGGFGNVKLREPMILGHEVSGYVAEVGGSVRGLNPGDLVAISPSRPCAACEQCLRGLPNQCLNMRFYGSAMPFPHIQGAFRESLIADASQCIKADGLNPAEAAMAEPLAVCLHAMAQAGTVLGKRVLVTGCGPIGVLIILAARRAGAAEIIATDITDTALERAKSAGADVVLNTMLTPEALAPYTSNKGTIDIGIECSGAEPALRAMIGALRPRATLVQLGLSGDMTLPMMQITAKELTIKGSFRFHSEFAQAVAFMQNGLIDVASLVTHSYPLAQFQEAFDTANDRSKAMKVQLDFS